MNALGAQRQIMCITHLPQVAAVADNQWQVAKTMSDGNVLSRVRVLEPKERIDEIARMLGGVKITEMTRRHAAEMLGISLRTLQNRIAALREHAKATTPGS